MKRGAMCDAARSEGRRIGATHGGRRFCAGDEDNVERLNQAHAV